MKKILLFGLLFMLGHSSYSQKKRILFEYISLEDGLTQSSVNSIIQDNTGFMWFATLDGLNKYDGYNIKPYRNIENDPFSIPDNAINVLYETFDLINPQLWVGTRGAGISKYNKLKDKFINFSHDYQNPNSLINNNIRALYGGNKTLWIGTERGLSRFEQEKDTFINFSSGNSDLPNSFVTSIERSEGTSIWIGTKNGLSKYDYYDNKFVNFFNDPNNPESLPDNTINCLFMDINQNLWIGTEKGLSKYNKEQNKFENFYANDKINNALHDGNITGITEDNLGIIWITTASGGLSQLNKETKEIYTYKHEPFWDNSLSTDNLLTIYQDRSNILWIGTLYRGVNKWNRAAEDLEVFRHNPYDPYSLSSNQVRSIYQDKKGIIWIGTVDGGLNKWDVNKNTFKHFRHIKGDNQSISNNHVRSILEDSRGNFWVGTDGGGLNLFDQKTGTFTTFKHEQNKKGTLTNNRVWKVYEDSEQNLWIATFGGGLDKYNYKTKTFENFCESPNLVDCISDNKVTTIYEDARGNLWVGTFGGGLNRYDKENKSFVAFKHEPENPKSIGHNRIYSIFEDRNNTLWIGTKGSLNKYDYETQTFKKYTVKDGFPNNVMMGILEDDSENLWVSTNSGLSRFNIQTEEIRNFDVRDGLQSNEFLVGAFCKANTGEMFFGGINGFNAFFPSKIVDNPNRPTIVITGFQVSNQEMSYDTIISEKKKITLKHNQNDLSFEFVALDYIFPQKNQYKCKLIGYDEDWIDLKYRRFVKYTNLAPQNYTFKVIGSNNDEVWNTKGTEIFVEIIPALWQRTWFKATYITIIIFIISFLVWYRIRSIKKQNERLEQLVKERTIEVVEKKDRIEKQLVQIIEQRDLIEIQNQDLTVQRDEIVQKNKEIKDSIVYAKRIQNAAIPSIDDYTQMLSDFFVLFRPKDIVSGDFHWTSTVDSKIIIVAADCTGHGVPGAFMSMLGISFLNKIVNEKNITSPDEILNHLRANVIRALHQTGEENEAKDGMDIAITVIDRKLNTIEFSGANNPLYLMRNNEAIVYKGDKMPIAIYDQMDPFKKEVLDMQKGDSYYIFSDGYPDQFGGPKGKKFMYKRMREFMLSISEKPMNEQKKLMEEKLDNWQGNYEQIDDIVMIGIKCT